MWATYKSEIMEREMDEKDFLKNFYERNRAQHEGEQAGRPCSLGSSHRIEELSNTNSVTSIFMSIFEQATPYLVYAFVGSQSIGSSLRPGPLGISTRKGILIRVNADQKAFLRGISQECFVLN